MDWKVINKEAEKPLKYPHLVRNSYRLHLLSKGPAFLLEETPKQGAVEPNEWKAVLIEAKKHELRVY